jgi:hypothetical protein
MVRCNRIFCKTPEIKAAWPCAAKSFVSGKTFIERRPDWGSQEGRLSPPHGKTDESLSLVSQKRSFSRLHLDTNKTRISGARRANVTGLGAREAHVDELALPKSVERRNISLNKAVFLRTAVYLK